MSSTAPGVLCYEERTEGFRLYLGEVSTAEGLALFEESTAITIVRFGATGYACFDWATEADLPPLPTVGAVRGFIAENDTDLGLIDFEAQLGSDVSLSSHDDGECSLLFRERPAILVMLRRVVPPVHAEPVIQALLTNPGHYVTCDSTGIIGVFTTFEAYLASRR